MAFGKRKNSGRTDWSGDNAPPTATMPQTSQPQMSQPETSQPQPGGDAKPGKRAKAPKPPKAERTRVTAEPRAGRTSGLLDLSDAMPSREEMEREAAAELQVALASSYNMLKSEVPDAGSAEEAQRKIESSLGPSLVDADGGIPTHPIYQGDALVYYQLRRHYGSPNAGGSFRRSWYPLSGG